MKNTFGVLTLLVVSFVACPADVIVSSPDPESAVRSPVHFIASSPGSVAMRIYSDDLSVFLAESDFLDTNVDLSQGRHHIVVQSWNPDGYVQRNDFYITVSGGDAGDETPNVTQIQNLPGWRDCDRCAGDGGVGHVLSITWISTSIGLRCLGLPRNTGWAGHLGEQLCGGIKSAEETTFTDSVTALIFALMTLKTLKL